MKIVKEHIYEKFTADSDPIYDMGIGMKKIYSPLKIQHILNAMTPLWKRIVRNAFNESLENIYYLGNSSRDSKEYLKRLVSLTAAGRRIFQKTFTTEYPDTGVPETITVKIYETELGKIGTFQYPEYEEEATQYLGSLDIAVELRAKENIKR
jgi:hypothetical protein